MTKRQILKKMIVGAWELSHRRSRNTAMSIFSLFLIFGLFQNCAPGLQVSNSDPDRNELTSIGFKTCSFNDAKIPANQAVLAYQSTSVPYKNQCAQEIRLCSTEGVLSGSFLNATCRVTAPKDCSFGGKSIAHGTSVIAYRQASVPAGQMCGFEIRTCDNASLSGTFQNSNCATSSAVACTFNNSSIQAGQGVIAYQSATVPFGTSCSSQPRVCGQDGILSGTYTAQTCTVSPPANCSFNGSTIAHNASVIAYSTATVPFGQTCMPQARTCNNGALSGSFTQASCVALVVPTTTPPTTPPTTVAPTTTTMVSAPQAPAPLPPSSGTPTDCTKVQCFYVRAGANGNGSDWTNAYGSLPAGLVRGATYFIADGTYPSYVFDDLESGTSIITVKKALASGDHGLNLGWLNSYGDEQTIFNGALIFARSYYVIDGQTRNENNWKDDKAYGFRAASIYGQNDNFPPGGNFLTVQYMSLGGTYSENYYSGMGEAVYAGGFKGEFHHWNISRSFLHNSTHTIIQFAGVHDMLVEYSMIGPGWGKEAIRGQGSCYNTTIRHNSFYNATQTDPEDSTSGITAEIGIWDGTNLSNNAIYGNTFYNSKSGGRNAVVVVGGNGDSWAGPGANGTKVYNNTFAGIAERSVFGSIVLNGSNTEAINNLFYACPNTNVTATITSGNYTATVDPFKNFAGLDFQLGVNSPARNLGTVLSSPFNTDRNNKPRGGDGQWDVGAWEY